MGLFRRKIKDPVIGTAEIVRCSMPGNPRAIRSTCHLFVVIDGPGLWRSSHELRKQVEVARWPSPGMTLPCRIDPERPNRFEIDFDSIPDWKDSARAAAAEAAEGGSASAGQFSGVGTNRAVVMNASSPEQAANAIRKAETVLGTDLDGDGRIG